MTIDAGKAEELLRQFVEEMYRKPQYRRLKLYRLAAQARSLLEAAE